MRAGVGQARAAWPGGRCREGLGRGCALGGGTQRRRGPGADLALSP